MHAAECYCLFQTPPHALLEQLVAVETPATDPLYATNFRYFSPPLACWALLRGAVSPKYFACLSFGRYRNRTRVRGIEKRLGFFRTRVKFLGTRETVFKDVQTRLQSVYSIQNNRGFQKSQYQHSRGGGGKWR